MSGQLGLFDMEVNESWVSQRRNQIYEDLVKFFYDILLFWDKFCHKNAKIVPVEREENIFGQFDCCHP
jgi:hypothetical protein